MYFMSVAQLCDTVEILHLNGMQLLLSQPLLVCYDVSKYMSWKKRETKTITVYCSLKGWFGFFKARLYEIRLYSLGLTDGMVVSMPLSYAKQWRHQCRKQSNMLWYF